MVGQKKQEAKEAAELAAKKKAFVMGEFELHLLQQIAVDTKMSVGNVIKSFKLAYQQPLIPCDNKIKEFFTANFYKCKPPGATASTWTLKQYVIPPAPPIA